MENNTWTKKFKSAILNNRQKLNFAFVTTSITIGKLCYDAGGDIFTAGAAGIGGAVCGFFIFGFVGSLVCGIRDESAKRKAARKNDNSNKEEENV